MCSKFSGSRGGGERASSQKGYTPLEGGGSQLGGTLGSNIVT